MKVIPKKFSITDTHILVAFKQIWKYLITKYKYKFKYRVRYLDLDEIKEAIDIFDDIRQPKCFPGNADSDTKRDEIIDAIGRGNTTSIKSFERFDAKDNKRG